MDQSLKKRRWIFLRVTLFIFLFKLLRWRWRLVIWENSSKPKVDFLNLDNIGMVRCPSTIDLLCLLVIQVQIGLSRHMRFLGWSRMSELWLIWRWR